MAAPWYVETIQEAFLMNGKPAIFNTDQGSQFTSELYVTLLKKEKVQISMPACRQRQGWQRPDDRLFARLAPGEFEHCFARWTQELATRLPGEVVPIDGKTVRGSYNHGDD